MKPTVGRVIYIRQENINTGADDAPFAGLITAVHSDGLINVAGYNATGCPLVANECPLVAPGDEWPTAGTFAHWMDYQIKAAWKDERNQENQAAAAAEKAASDSQSGPEGKA